MKHIKLFEQFNSDSPYKAVMDVMNNRDKYTRVNGFLLSNGSYVLSAYNDDIDVDVVAENGKLAFQSFKRGSALKWEDVSTDEYNSVIGFLKGLVEEYRQREIERKTHVDSDGNLKLSDTEIRKIEAADNLKKQLSEYFNKSYEFICEYRIWTSESSNEVYVENIEFILKDLEIEVVGGAIALGLIFKTDHEYMKGEDLKIVVYKDLIVDMHSDFKNLKYKHPKLEKEIVDDYTYPMLHHTIDVIPTYKSAELLNDFKEIVSR